MSVEDRNSEIEILKDRLNNENLNTKEKNSIEKQIKKYEKMNKKSDFWNNLATKTDNAGEKMQRVGDSMTKTGLKTTAAVWTPAIYIGYKALKKVKGKNDTPESDLIELVKECEQAHKEGKIDEVTMKEYIIDFTNNHYRK